MKHSSQFSSEFYSAILSVFDIEGTLRNIRYPTTRLEHDMQQLANDQSKLICDYQKSKEQLNSEDER